MLCGEERELQPCNGEGEGGGRGMKEGGLSVGVLASKKQAKDVNTRKGWTSKQNVEVGAGGVKLCLSESAVSTLKHGVKVRHCYAVLIFSCNIKIGKYELK